MPGGQTMSGLPNYPILNAVMEGLPPDDLKAMQGQRLVNMVNYVYEGAPFWKKKFDEAGVKPKHIKGIDDLAKIPFCTKAELQADQDANPPFGSYACSRQSTWARLLSTSGTTGRPLRRVFSHRDWGYILDRFQRKPFMGPGEISIILGPVDGLMGPTAAMEAGARMGAIMVPAGLLDSKSKLRLIQEMKPVAISGTASYLLRLLEVAAEMGIDATTLGLRSVGSVGEPGGALEATRKRLEDGWNARIADGFGLTEIFPLGGNCPGNRDLHIAPDMAITEIVDPESGEQLPPGEAGEAVFSNIVGDTQPLLRFRSRDISKITAGEACPACGHTGPRLAGSIIGRVDDMIWFRGANIFPSAIEAAVRGIDALGHEFQIEISGKQALPEMTVRLESAGKVSPKAGEKLRRQAAAAIKDAIRVNANVELSAPGTLPRDDSGGKVRRVLDRRAKALGG